ncbi:MAG: ATPase [Caulobacterales bacterium]
MKRASLIRALACAAAAWALIAPAHAEVRTVSPQGFTLQLKVASKADPQQAWKAFLKVQNWWSGAHTYSGDARNLRIDPRAGGCWCETLPRGGAVKHGEVVLLMPDKLVRLSTALGPLQSMGASGALTAQFAGGPNGGSTMTLTYAVSGADAAGWTDVAKAVDSVMTEQAQRFAAYADGLEK